MEALIDVVGHFGTTFSYATVASRVAGALRDAKLLGSVSNLDPGWHPAHERFRGGPRPRATHVALFTPPNHYVDAYPELYGRDRSAIFMSPNTDKLASEHAETCAQFGLAMVPSQWCETVVANAAPEVPVARLPLGVDASYAADRISRQRRLRRRADPGGMCRVLHLSSDQAWPGRKGTQELLLAWEALHRSGLPRSPTLALDLHVPPALRTDAEYLIRDLGIDETVTVLVGKERGAEGELLALLDDADLLVAPSRCEGFGMMFLASLVAGVPLACTYNTGQVDFLIDRPGWIGVPSHGAEPLFGEEGNAPVIDAVALATTLSVAVQAEARVAMVSPLVTWSLREDPAWGTWDVALKEWVERLQLWMEETA